MREKDPSNPTSKAKLALLAIGASLLVFHSSTCCGFGVFNGCQDSQEDTAPEDSSGSWRDITPPDSDEPDGDC